uniref:dual specificity protein phosphatase 8-like n=1 Tax=Callithrix jacchus TaxID=9483 RepID=UPI0023DD0D8A|nr:dual specificity protein phosphatase 8-like [Callithrix jacchus]
MSPHTPADGHTLPPRLRGPPSPACNPAERTRVPDCRSRALRLPARPTHWLLPQAGAPLAAAGARPGYQPPRPPAPPHNMASLGFRNGAREIQQGPLNIHERLRGSRLGRRCGEGGKERASEGRRRGTRTCTARAGPRREGGCAAACWPEEPEPPPRPEPADHAPRAPTAARRSPQAMPGRRRRHFVVVNVLLGLFCPGFGPPSTPSWPGSGVWSETSFSLKCNGMISAHYNLCLPSSSNSAFSDS